MLRMEQDQRRPGSLDPFGLNGEVGERFSDGQRSFGEEARRDEHATRCSPCAKRGGRASASVSNVAI